MYCMYRRRYVLYVQEKICTVCTGEDMYCMCTLRCIAVQTYSSEQTSTYKSTACTVHTYVRTYVLVHIRTMEPLDNRDFGV